MQVWVALIACFALCSCADSAVPTHVTYLLSGTMSGPYRLSADLIMGILEEADRPTVTTNNVARLDPRDIPVTKTRQIDPNVARQIRHLAANIFENGMFSKAACSGQGIPSPDAFLMFEITVQGVTGRFYAPGGCETKEASQLQHILYCTANPTEYGCS